MPWFPLPDESALPQLPLSEPPKGNRLRGQALEQARVLGAAPAALRPYLASSRYGESGVDVETTSGIELRFGDSSQAARKWKAAVAVLADPDIEALDYVDLHAPAAPRDRWLWAYACRPLRLNPRPAAVSLTEGLKPQVGRGSELAGCLPAV